MQERESGRREEEEFQAKKDVRFLGESVPEMQFRRSVLSQPASWSVTEKRAVSLGELVASRMPEQASRLGIEPYTGEETVKRVNELNDEEIKQVVVESLSTTTDLVLASGDSSYTMEQLRDEVERGTIFGQQLIDMHRRHMGVMEQLFETGKVTGLTDEEPKTIIAYDFPF